MRFSTLLPLLAEAGSATVVAHAAIATALL